MSGEHTRGHGGWSAVVYGRTYRIDRWWRALPEGETSGGTLGRTVLAVVAGGARLDAGPRFVLYRGGRGVLVGAACRMPLLGPAMAYDEHGRPLYGFVGWHHPDPSAAHDLPGLDELEASFPQWAGDTYRAWAAPVWEAAREPDAVTLASTAEPAPWPDRGRPADPAAAARWPAAHAADVHLLPAAQAPGLWDAALAAGPTADCVLTTGWQQSRDAREPGLTHACCADVTEYRRAPRPAPQAPARAPEPAPKPAGERAGERVQKPARHSREKEGKGFLGWMAEALRHVIDGDRSDTAPPAGRPRPAKRGGTPHRPAHLTGGAAYEPEPPARSLLGRPREVDAEEASFDGYFGAFGTPGTTSSTEPANPAASGGAARPGTAAEGRGVTSEPGGPSAAGSGGFARPGTASSAEDGRPAEPRPASAPGGFVRPGTAAEGGGAAAVPGAGRDGAGSGRDQGDVEDEGAGSGSARAPGPGAWGALTPDADGPAGPGHPHRSDPGGTA
ncbi:hypothetical protein [Streptomyces yangpuensis]|uniref:hypothetical protein n=1 Tax=Streptomyces yangpuensis TaxID=1648182 RepID=UPI000629A629|nr:hypothetical protein [Streptomyces yangpuensis]